MEVKITNENYESYKNGSLPLVIDFWATWCGPCRMVAPIIEELANEYEGKVTVGKCGRIAGQSDGAVLRRPGGENPD